MFSKVLIANRGEVAARIIHACQKLNITTVAVYSTVDKDALFTREADQAICVGSAEPRASYLNREAILMAAINAGVDAIHPGYGFLAEDGLMAKMCAECGITWIGPSPELIELMGDKIAARKYAASRGVAIIPGQFITNDEPTRLAAQRVGFPLLIKAAHGGGGKGIRRVSTIEEFNNAFDDVQKEAQNAFLTNTVYLEKELPAARHIEVQILGDVAGKIIILGDRDCSLQVHTQKIIEESPATYLGSSQRQELYKMVHQLLDNLHYEGVGTVEFLFSEDRFYFLEMNTRLQVEHGVTEMTSHVDIVREQLMVAAKQEINEDEPRPTGVAIEVRLNARPETIGHAIKRLIVPPNVRFETNYQVGEKILSYYDSLIAKMIVFAETRKMAIQEMICALKTLQIDGIQTNQNFLLEIMQHPKYQQNNFSVKSLGTGDGSSGTPTKYVGSVS